MCDTCGCSEQDVSYNIPGGHANPHEHKHSPNVPGGHEAHSHHHYNKNESSHTIRVEQNLLGENDRLAERNRGYFEALNIQCFNLVSSPGSGKTSLLEETIKQLNNSIKVYVIEGDQQTLNDAERIKKAGAVALQINTGNGCHLDAHMVYHAVQQLKPDKHSLLFIENVGNLVCPALFDLGETNRIIIASTTEGEDKPLKYPNMFATSSVCVINKTDLIPYTKFNIDEFKSNALKINNQLTFIETVSAITPDISKWLAYLKHINT